MATTTIPSDDSFKMLLLLVGRSSVHSLLCGKVEENYNCDASKGAPWCEDPRKRVFWDGTHPTQEAYRLLTE
ncbi:hypothetical protein V2J09_006904 [Rumex salicifolius]